jgi:hypothetical protein
LDGKEQARTRLISAGADLFLNGVEVRGAEIVVGGSVGGQALLIGLGPGG